MLDVLKFIWYTMIENETNDFVWYCRTFTKGGQYIEKNQGRFKYSPSYNDMGDKKVEENIQRSKPRTFEVNGNTYTIVREFECKGSSILEEAISMLIDKMQESVNVQETV